MVHTGVLTQEKMMMEVDEIAFLNPNWPYLFVCFDFHKTF
jgi:hypothetical protein